MEAKNIQKRMKEHAKAKLVERQPGYGSHPAKELCWLFLRLIPSHFLRLDGCMALSSRTREGDI